MKPSTLLPRRRFLRQAATAATAVVGASYLGFPSLRAAGGANSKLGVAVIAADGMGGYSFDSAMKERFVAVCDVDDNKMAAKLKYFSEKVKDQPAPKAYFDYRKMLDECHKDIDVVLIATPDHHHAPAAIRAINLGKAVFSQKPLAHNIYECYALAKAAREKKVLTQMGNQGHCSEVIRQACEFIWAGAIGNVTETHSLLGRDFGGSGGRPASKPVPAGLHWDEWLGPAPYRDYHDGLHTFGWRNWRQFGTGTIGDMACHNLDALFWALKLGEAKSFTVECLQTKGGSDEMWPQSNVVRYEIPARAGMVPVKVTVYDNAALRSDFMKEVEQKYNLKLSEDTLFVGDKGLLRTGGTCGSVSFLPEERRYEIPQPPKSIPRAHGGPIEDLFHACKNGTMLELPGRLRPADRFRAHRASRPVCRSGQEVGVGRRGDEVHQRPRDQPLRPPRVPGWMGGLIRACRFPEWAMPVAR